jgi:hypothetical protein
MQRKWKNRILPRGITLEQNYVVLRLRIEGKLHKEFFGQVNRDSLDRAERKLKELERKVNGQETNIVITHTPIPFNRAAELFIEKHGKARSRSYKYHFVALKEYFGKYNWHDLDPEIVGGEDGKSGYRAYRKAQGVIDSTVNRDLSVLSRMYTKFEEWKVRKKHGVERLKIPQLNPTKFVFRVNEDRFRRKRILNEEELACIAGYCTPRLLRIVIGSLSTVLRKADLLGVTPSQFVDTVNKIEGIQGKTGHVYNLPQTESIRFLLETSDGNKLLDKTNMRREWYTMVAAVKDHYKSKGQVIEDFQYRDLRRTALMAVYDETEDIIICRDIAGHKRSTTTEIYLGVQAKGLKKAGQALEKKTKHLVGILRAKSLNQNAEKMPKLTPLEMAVSGESGSR